MRTLAAVLGLVFVLGSVPSAHAGWWIFGGDDKVSTKKSLPKAIDYPMIRPKMRDDHKQDKRAGDHPEHGRQLR
jgi:hypothetical protein